MDVGLVCDGCRTFNPMGSRECARCGEVLSLDGVPAAPRKVVDAAGSAPVAAPKLGKEGSTGAGAGVRPCATCGAIIHPGFRFCGTCGATVSSGESRSAGSSGGARGAPQIAPGVIAALQAGGGSGKKTLFFGAMQAARAKLTVIKGDGLDGVSFSLAGDEHQAGRQDVPLLFADDPYMSPVHANFFYRKGQLVVRDEGSVNGVYIRIRGSIALEFGDRFLVGEQIMEVQRSLDPTEPMVPMPDGTYFYASPRPPSPFRLIQILRGGDTGQAYQAAADVVSLGREGNDINFPDDPFISGHHSQVSYANGQLTLTDLGSKNGTFLRLSRESVLQHGDYVFMGQQLLRVEIV